MKDLITRYPLNDGIGYVSLITSMGNDLSVVNAARVSYGKHSEEFTEKDAKLIRYLLRNTHGTPLEHIHFQFRVRAPLFVVHQWQRHRLSSYNEESARYIEMREDCYTPAIDRPDIGANPEEALRLMQEHWQTCFDLYNLLMAGGMTKELARLVLPASLYKEFWWSVNARSLLNFLALRNEDHAQWEIRQYAIALEDIFRYIAPHTLAAFADNGRVAP